LIGTPGSGVVYDSNKQVRKSLVTIRLEPTNEIPADFANTEYERHYAKLYRSSINTIDNQFDIDGMSGGPIFGLKPFTSTSSNQYEYRIIGVQSSRNNSDYVAFCKVAPFIEFIQHHCRS
jgi:hypothetical protein